MTNVSEIRHTTPVPDAGTRGAGGSFWSSLGGTTIKLAALFWSSILLVDSLLWSLAGVDPVESATAKILLNSFGAVLTIGITALLYRIRRASLLVKVILAFVLSTLAAPVYALVDFQIYRWYALPDVPAFDLRIFGMTTLSSSAMFFGWACLFVALVYSFDVRDRERKLAAAREEALSAQMRALRYQINPHFLFNTLNSIAALIEEGAATRAERMVLSLSTFLRTTLEQDPLSDVPLAEELALQREYLEIEQERFPDRLAFTIDAADDVLPAMVPSFILQPLVENAIKHGVGRSSRHVAIRIMAHKRAGTLSLAVENELDLDRASPTGFGIGLRNVAERLSARFGNDGRFTAGPSGDRLYRAEIELPWKAA